LQSHLRWSMSIACDCIEPDDEQQQRRSGDG